MLIYHIALELVVYICIGSLVAWLYHRFGKKSLPGKFWVGAFVGTAGAVLVALLASMRDWFTSLMIWLMVPKINGDLYFRINLLAAFMGAILFVYILRRISHNR